MKDKKAKGKYANKGTVSRFFHKYTGFIIVGLVIFAIAGMWNYSNSQMYFFESWPCVQINGYLFSGNSYGFPPHDELSEAEHQRLHEIYQECGTGSGLLTHK